MAGQRQHDKICVQPVDAMGSVAIVALRLALGSDVVHDFMLALSWGLGVAKYDRKVAVLRLLLGHSYPLAYSHA